MSSFGGSQDSNLTAVDLKLPRAWMDASKGDTTDDRGDIGMGSGTFGNHKTWTSLNGDASGRMANRSASFGNHRGRSEYHSARSRNNNNRLDQDYHDGSANDSARLDYYRNQSAATIMTPKSTGNLRDAVQEWQRKSTTATRRLVENRQTRTRGEEGVDNAGFQAQELSPCRGGGGGQDSKVYEAKQSLDTAYSSVHDSSQNDSCGVGAGGNNMALVKASASGSGSTNAVTTSGGEGTPVVQCYTVTKKVTTTTYGDDEGDEETSVVTSTEKKWREGMNEVGEISMSASASAGELLPSIGAPSAVLSDTSNVRTVKSLTNVEGGASNIVRRYEYQQARNETDTHVGSTLHTTRTVSDTLL
ncbi:uncharacterized protein [Littorina saxatilis]|uniref:uncharacterized protein isoform X2 n=1 Tax=Littorina saxatilis TaxID=31220 RepID=UPI0038B5C6E6